VSRDKSADEGGATSKPGGAGRAQQRPPLRSQRRLCSLWYEAKHCEDSLPQTARTQRLASLGRTNSPANAHLPPEPAGKKLPVLGFLSGRPVVGNKDHEGRKASNQLALGGIRTFQGERSTSLQTKGKETRYQLVETLRRTEGLGRKGGRKGSNNLKTLMWSKILSHRATFNHPDVRGQRAPN
jgi:hypothetical protein